MSGGSATIDVRSIVGGGSVNKHRQLGFPGVLIGRVARGT
jgi:hypothetical protein